MLWSTGRGNSRSEIRMDYDGEGGTEPVGRGIVVGAWMGGIVWGICERFWGSMR